MDRRLSSWVVQFHTFDGIGHRLRQDEVRCLSLFNFRRNIFGVRHICTICCCKYKLLRSRSRKFVVENKSARTCSVTITSATGRVRQNKEIGAPRWLQKEYRYVPTVYNFFFFCESYCIQPVRLERSICARVTMWRRICRCGLVSVPLSQFFHHYYIAV
jgi:hypothetical protein